MDGTGSERGLSTMGEPEWTVGASRWRAALYGARETPVTPALILALSFIGFGALTNETGLSLLHTLFMGVFIFALPGQVVLVDEMARGASVVTAGFAVTATAIRLLPMTAALLPVVRERGGPKWLEFLVAYYVAITVWVEAMRRAPFLPRRLRGAYAMGISGMLIIASQTGAIIGFLLAANVPKLFAAALLFITPIYFLLSMLAASRAVGDLLPIFAGLVLAPLLHLAFPQWDLLLTGLIGGTLSFLAARWLRRRSGPA
jgi:predicted branched-subunit amino acid permease